MRKVYLTPKRAQDGIERVLEALIRYLPDYGWTVTDNPEEADLVNGHVMMADNREGKPFVHSNHGLYWHGFDWPHDFLRANQIIIDNMVQSQAITCPSNWVKQSLSRGLLQPIDVIHHGIDLDRFTPKDNSGFVLWNKGRHDPVSNPDEMNQLAALLPSTPFVSTLGTPADNVQILGRVAHDMMPDLVASAGVYLATARETFGIGTLEALSCGVPVAGWAHGGQVEIIRQGETGYLAPHGDYEALAWCVGQCFSQRPALSENAREDVLIRWLWPDKIARYADVFNRVYDEWHKPRPKVTVIVTCHNLGKYLPDALHSVQRQRLKDFECLIVDDFSADETPQIAREWAKTDSRFKYLRTPENLKLSGARNYGFNHANGKYIINLDADDAFFNGTLDKLADALDNDPTIHIAYGHLDVMNEEGGDTRRNDWPVQFNWYQQMAHLNQLPYCSMMRREVWEQSGGYRIRDWRAEDASLWCRITSLGFRAKKVTEDSLLLYRLRSNSKGSEERAKHHDNDGDWTGWYGWRVGAATPLQGAKMLQEGKTVNPLKVPFGAQGRRAGDISWPVHAHHDPVISVVVPVGPGHDRYLTDVCDCLLAQSYPFWELVIVNNTGKEINAPHFARVVEQPLRGIAHARNKGLEAAVAPLVLFLDADDLLLPYALEYMLNAYIENGGSKYIFTDWYAVNDEGGIEHKKSMPDTQKDWKVNHPISVLVNREHALNVGGFDADIKGWEDWDFFIKLRISGYCPAHLPEPLLVYRTHAGQRREQSLNDKDDILPVLHDRYAGYYKGRDKMTGCCGGNGNIIMQAKQSLMGLTGQGVQPMANRNGTVRLIYVGANKGSITFRKEGLSREYRGGSNALDRYVDAAPQDVAILESTGKWKAAKAESGIDLSQAAVPQPEPQVFVPQTQKRTLLNPSDMTVNEAKSYAAGLGLESLNEFIGMEKSDKNRVTLVVFLETLVLDVERIN